MPDFDMAVIGAGSAGLSIAYAATQLGLTVALIERDRMGGDCLNVGCVPSKALLAAAHAAETARTAGRLGIGLPRPAVDWAGVQLHVHDAIVTIAPIDSEARYTGLGATVLRANARFTGRASLAVNGRTLKARWIVIAAGSRARVPDLPGLAGVPYLTHANLFDLRERPDHLLIIGGGPIGLEMAQAHAGLGCQVTVVQKGRIAPKDDPDLVAPLRDLLRTQGVRMIEGANIAAVEPGPALLLQDGTRIAGSHLLVATGRQPNVEGLGLDAADIRASSRGIATDAGLRSLTNRAVYAVGDIADPADMGPRYFTHVGSYHAGIVIRRAVFRLPARVDYAALPHVTYTDPELAQVGMTEAEARAAGWRASVLRFPMAENDRAITEARTEGLVKLVVSPRGRVLGAGILAPHAGEMIGVWTLAIARQIPLAAMAGMIVPYPTRSEAGKRAAGSRYAARLFAPRTRRLVRLLTRLP
jgi:pyruvate/2-oxoglutarate dehydrogenase complex dihydrolipoamide dehydrogenase (E3) component